MASLPFLLLLTLSSLLQIQPTLSLLFPLTKHSPTAHYLTHLGPTTGPLLLHLNGPILWTHCGPSHPTPVPSRSIQCSSLKTRPDPSRSTCTLSLHNPLTGATATGYLVEEHQFLFSCGPSTLLTGLPSMARGVLGLGRTRVGPMTQISHSLGHPKRFSLCLSPSNGFLLSGQHLETSKSLTYAPLLIGGDFYSVSLKGIKIQDKKLSLGNLKDGILRFSTVSQFTKLETSLYNVFTRAFSMAAESFNMTRAPAVEPFGLCYRVSGSVPVPVIDLVLQSEMVKWRINGHNSMVKVNEKGVTCLGFLDGGSDLSGASVVLGGYQLEDNLLEFDLGSSMLGFSSSLIMKQTSCSKLGSLGIVRKDVQSF